MSQLRTVNEEELEETHKFNKEYVGSHEDFEDFKDRFEKWPETFIAYFEDGEILGAASGKLESEGKMGLESIGVKEGYKGEGIGSKILRFFEEKAAKYADRVTIASADNVEGFYQANGYRPVQIMLQVKKSELPENYNQEERVVDEKDVDEETIFLYADFEDYSEDLRDNLKSKFSAFEVNTIYEKDV